MSGRYSDARRPRSHCPARRAGIAENRQNREDPAHQGPFRSRHAGFDAFHIGTLAGRLFSRGSGFDHPLASGSTLGVGLCFAMFVGVLTLLFAQEIGVENIQDGDAAPAYWMLKITGVFFALLSTLAISVVFEAATIFHIRHKKKEFPKRVALQATLKANLWTLLIVSIAGAVYAIPQRLSTPGFLLLE